MVWARSHAIAPQGALLARAQPDLTGLATRAIQAFGADRLDWSPHGTPPSRPARRASMAFSSCRISATASRSYNRSRPARADGRMCVLDCRTYCTRCRGTSRSAASTPGVRSFATDRFVIRNTLLSTGHTPVSSRCHVRTNVAISRVLGSPGRPPRSRTFANEDANVTRSGPRAVAK